jgi:hypothetical protein
MSSRKTANKTTAAPNRWYSYANLFDTLLNDNHTLETNITFPVMWQNDKILGGFTSAYDTIEMVSVATVLDPSTPDFNNPLYYTGEMKIGATNSYTVNQVEIFGVYDFNPANTAVVDTLRLSFVKGFGGAPGSDDIFSGGSLTGGHYGAVSFLSTRYDTALNYAKTRLTPQGTASDIVVDVILNNSGTSPAWGDTTAGGVWTKIVTLPTPISVPANGMVGMSYSFKSGSTATITPYDTLFYQTGAMKYNMFRALTIFAADGAGDPQWAPYSAADSNCGYFKTLPHTDGNWGFQYIPLWAWSSTSASGAATSQYPVVNWNINCTSCGDVTPSSNVGSVATIEKSYAYPNPANNSVTVPFTLSSKSNVSVTLSNMIGQVVETQNIENALSGKAVFNTTTLPNGLYTYSVIANGQRTTGRVAITH